MSGFELQVFAPLSCSVHQEVKSCFLGGTEPEWQGRPAHGRILFSPTRVTGAGRACLCGCTWLIPASSAASAQRPVCEQRRWRASRSSPTAFDLRVGTWK